MVIYDTRSGRYKLPCLFLESSDVPVPNSPCPVGEISELSIHQPTEHELEAAATSPDALIGVWTRNLRALSWMPWRDNDELWGIQTLDEEEEF